MNSKNIEPELMEMNDEQMFETLVRGMSPQLYRYAYGLCRNPDVAQDLVQETFMRAWKSKKSLREAKAVRAWLYTILRNEHARLYERKRPEIRDPATLPEIASMGYDTSPEAFNLRRALQKLDDDYREPLMLQLVGGFSCKEIGKILDLKENTVLTRVFRARKTLREMLAPANESTKSKGGVNDELLRI